MRKSKGITLVALVVTIVVLLILAGVSISLVLGQNGLITYAKKAIKETMESNTKENVDMALASFEIEKATNKNLTLKEYLENSEKSGLDNFELIDENPSEDVQFIGSLDGKILIMKTDGSYVLTKGENLVKNGFGYDGNSNFPSFTNNNRAFSITTNRRNGYTGNELIPVDVNKNYYESIIIKTNNPKAEFICGLSEFDIDEKDIRNEHYSYVQNSLTYLEQDLNDGDTEIYVNNLSGFIKNNIRNDNKGLIFWNYKDSTGYQYPELTYSRNVYSDLFGDENNFDIENNKIILNSPWSYGKFEKGTKLSQKSNGATYSYSLISGNISEKYKLYSCVMSGTKLKGYNEYTKFCSATKYIKIWLGLNYSDISNVTTEIKDIIFAECE